MHPPALHIYFSSIAKKIVAVDPPPVDVNLDSDIYILFGRRKTASVADKLLIHEEFPKISAKRYNPVRDDAKGKEDNFPKLPLVRAHGVLMLIAWPLFGMSGIFFAAWMQPALPKGQWFQVWNNSNIFQFQCRPIPSFYCYKCVTFTRVWG